MRKSISLRTIFAVNFAAIIIILVLITSSIISRRSTEEYKNQIGDSLSEISFQTTDKLSQYMWSRYGEISLLSKLDVFTNTKDKTAIRGLLEELKSYVPEYAWIGMLDTKGIILSSTGGILEGADGSSRPVYQQGMKGPFIGDVHEAVMLAKLLPNPSGEPLRFVDISVPVKDLDGNLKGVLASHLSWEWVEEVKGAIMEPLKKRNDLEVFIVSADNIVVLGPNNTVGEKLSLTSLETSRKGENSWTIDTWADGKKYLTGYASEKGYKNYKGLGWTILVRQPLEVAYAPVVKLKNFIILVGIFSACLFAIVGWVVAGIIAMPLQRIAFSANELRLGNKIEMPKYKGIRDIEILSDSLRSLLNNLIKTESALGHMEEIAHNDQLTNLCNRAALMNYLDELKTILNRDGSVYSIFYLDLDGFKFINDNYGHDAGDLILKEVAKRLSQSVTDGEIAARMGGDEFVIIKKMTLGKHVDNSKLFANNLIKEISEAYLIKGTIMNIGCSIGGAFYPLQGEDPMEIIRLADQNLYESKRAGKRRYTCA